MTCRKCGEYVSIITLVCDTCGEEYNEEEKVINMKITKWYIINPNGHVSFNHIQDGWVKGHKPLPIKPEFTNQLAWQNHTWIKTFKYLNV